MWCPNCEAEIVPRVSDEGTGLLCGECGSHVAPELTPSDHPDTRLARDLLQQWSLSAAESSVDDHSVDQPPGVDQPSEAELEHLIDALASTDPAETAPVDGDSADAADTQPVAEEPVAANVQEQPQLPDETQVPVAAGPRKHRVDPGQAEFIEPAGRKIERRQPQFRFDSAHQVVDTEPQTMREPSGSVPPPHPPRTRPVTTQRRSDAGHAAVAGPHFDMHQFMAATGQRPGKAESLWGQLLAYGGVGMLTIGTSLVLMGYFGGPESYAPTGWLVATAGQMLLLLGVVTLVSGGMQQTTHEVSRRVEYLGSQMIRIEQATEELRGPHFATDGQPTHDHAVSEPGTSAT